MSRVVLLSFLATVAGKLVSYLSGLHFT